MKKQEKILLAVGIVLIVYAVFSRFYGEPSIAMKYFRSTSVLLLANTFLILAVLVRK